MKNAQVRSVAWGGVCFNAPSWRWDHSPKRIPEMHLWCVAQGRGSVRADGVDFELSRGACFVFRFDERISARQDCDAPLTLCSSTFIMRDPESGAPWKPSREELPLFRQLDNFDFFESIFLRFADASLRKSENSDSAACAWLRALLDELSRPDEPRFDERRKTVAALVSKLMASPGEAPSLEEIANELGCSKNQALRLFKSFTDRTPGEHLRKARGEKARALLSGSSLSIKEIAAQLGYCDQFAFSKAFRGMTGVSPLEFRRSSGSSERLT